MQDTVNNINSWFKAARPIVSEQDKQVQLGVYYEEVCEFAETLVGEDEHSKSALNQLTQLLATISQGLKNGDIFFSIPEEKIKITKERVKTIPVPKSGSNIIKPKVRNIIKKSGKTFLTFSL